MCRSIKRLRNETTATRAEIEAASLQFVRKISGFHKPSRINQEAFDAAVAEIARSAERMLNDLTKPVERQKPNVDAGTQEPAPQA